MPCIGSSVELSSSPLSLAPVGPARFHALGTNAPSGGSLVVQVVSSLRSTKDLHHVE